MDIILNPVFWAALGGLMMLAELIVPGGIIFFLGAGCLIVAAAIWAGLVSTWVGALTLFFIASLILILALRSVFTRLVGGDYTKANTDEFLDELDRVVAVVKTIGPGERKGKVSFRGVRWRALGNGTELAAGSYARIVAREATTLIVEPCAAPVTPQRVDEDE